EHRVVALGEQFRVVVARVAVHDQDVRLRYIPSGDAVHFALPDQAADLHVVEADVVAVGRPSGHQPVVVDDLRTGRLGLGLDGCTGTRVKRVDQEDGSATADHRVGLRLHGRGAALGVLDRELIGRQPGRLEGLLEVRGVVLDVPSRGRRVGQQDTDLALALRRQTGQLLHQCEVRGEGRRVDLWYRSGRRRRRAR